MKVCCVQLLFYLVAVRFMIDLVYNVMFLYIEAREMKEKEIGDLKSLVKEKEGKLTQEQLQVQYKCY